MLTNEVVQTNAATIMEKLTKELPKLQSNSLQLKNAILNYIDDVYVNISYRPKSVQFLQETNKLIDVAKELHSLMKEAVDAEVPDIDNVFSQFQSQLQSIDETLGICLEVSSLYEQTQKLCKYIDTQAYVQAAELILKLEASEFKQNSKVMETLERLVYQCKSKFLKTLSNVMIDQYIQYSHVDNVVKFSVKLIEQGPIQEAIRAGIKMDNYLLWHLSHIIWDALEAIVKNAALVEINEDEITVIMEEKSKLTLHDIFNNIMRFWDQLSINSQTTDTYSPLKHIGEYFPGNFSDLILKRLEESIPTNEQELANYSLIADSVTILVQTFDQKASPEGQCQALLDYVANINVDIANKECQAFNKIAIGLMKKNLQDTVSVGQACDPKEMSIKDFQPCAVSKSVLELLDLIRSIIEMAVKKPSETKANYYIATAITLLEKYPASIECIHESLLIVPKQRAIFSNNCKYIANEVNSLAWYQLLEQLPPPLRGFDGLTNVAHDLNAIGIQMMQICVQEQVDEITTRINDSGIHLTSTICDPSCAKAIRDCLRQQEMLKTIWQDVLNQQEYNNSMGLLLDALCASFVTNVLRVENIGTDAADQLANMIQTILTSGPKLFTEPGEILNYVKNWEKLSELMSALNSSLESFGERWAKGEGPLALHFTSEELLALIRALFPNSTKRVSLLSEIS